MSINFRQLQDIVREQGTEAFDTTRKCCENGWYDWFCSDSSLKNRTKKFFPLILGISEGGKVDFEWEAWFKNNYPCAYDGTYDQLRISSDDQNEFVIGYKEPYEDAEGKTWCVYGPQNDFEKPVALFDNVRQLVKWLNEA